MRQRLDTHQGPFPAAAVYRMWREMMCAFTLMQTPDIKVAICRPHDQPGYWDLGARSFRLPDHLRRQRHAGPGAGRGARQPLDAGRRPVPIEADAAPWWPLLAGRDATLPNIVARLPFWSCPTPARAASRPSCWRAWSPRSRATTAPWCRSSRWAASAATASPAPSPRRASPPLLRCWTSLQAACITISSSCRA